MQIKSFMFNMILSELEDAVGRDNVSVSEAEKASYTVDYFWLSRMWQDRGAEGPKPDIIVRPGSAQEVSKVLNVPVGSTSADGKYSVEATRCIGACGLAPVLTINGEVYGRLTKDDIPGILAKYM